MKYELFGFVRLKVDFNVLYCHIVEWELDRERCYLLSKTLNGCRQRRKRPLNGFKKIKIYLLTLFLNEFEGPPPYFNKFAFVIFKIDDL